VVEAITAAPPMPKPKRKDRSSGFVLSFQDLTCQDAGFVVRHGKKRKIGGIVGLADGRFAAWSMREKIGDYDSPGDAVKAVRERAAKK
jgi:hypothetical protein